MKRYAISFEENQHKLDALLRSSKYIDKAAYYFENGEIYIHGAAFHEDGKPETKLEPKTQYAIECFQRAADYGHAAAQFQYAVILEEQGRLPLATLYYIKAALQDNREAYEKLDQHAHFLLTKLSVLKAILTEERLIKDNKFVLGDEQGNYQEHNNTEITQIICAYKALMDLYGYIFNKSSTDRDQLAKRHDFATILRMINDNNANQVAALLTVHQTETQTRFIARSYGNIWRFSLYKGYEQYHTMRELAFGVIKRTPMGLLKTVSAYVLEEIVKDNLLGIEAARDILNAPNNNVRHASQPQPQH